MLEKYRITELFLKFYQFQFSLSLLFPSDAVQLYNNKTPAKAFTPPAEKKIGTRWSFVKKVNE